MWGFTIFSKDGAKRFDKPLLVLLRGCENKRADCPRLVDAYSGNSIQSFHLRLQFRFFSISLSFFLKYLY